MKLATTELALEEMMLTFSAQNCCILSDIAFYL